MINNLTRTRDRATRGALLGTLLLAAACNPNQALDV